MQFTQGRRTGAAASAAHHVRCANMLAALVAADTSCAVPEVLPPPAAANHIGCPALPHNSTPSSLSSPPFPSKCLCAGAPDAEQVDHCGHCHAGGAPARMHVDLQRRSKAVTCMRVLGDEGAGWGWRTARARRSMRRTAATPLTGDILILQAAPTNSLLSARRSPAQDASTHSHTCAHVGCRSWPRPTCCLALSWTRTASTLAACR